MTESEQACNFEPWELGPSDCLFDVPQVMYEFFLDRPRYRCVHGGRGSVKSWSIARALVMIAARKKRRILCAREFQKSIRESVHYLLKSQIDRLGLTNHFDVRDTRITCPDTGSEFIFTGLHHNVSSIKSMEQIDICWIEEAETVSQDSWDTLDPTIRAPGSEIWLSFNPKEETDPVYQMFVVHPLPGSKTIAVGWGDNPWLPDVLKQQALYMREHDPERYDHIWGGKTWFLNDCQVLNRKWCIKDFDPRMTGRKDFSAPLFGIDFGFSQDPSCLTKSYVEVLNPEDIGKTVEVDKKKVRVPLHKNLYIAEEAYAKPGTPAAEVNMLHKTFDTVSEFRLYPCFADSARPETISHLVKIDGLVMVAPCDKWKGSVEDGIAYLRSFEKIFIHPACTNIAEEARLWSFKKDKITGLPLRELKPGYDHGFDATRYAHQKLITRTPTIFSVL